MAIPKGLLLAFAWVSTGLIGIGLVVVGIGYANLINSVRMISMLLFFFCGWLFAIWLSSIAMTPGIVGGLALLGLGLAMALVNAILVSVSAGEESI
jgi:mannose/fructose/N-acetylgalactosamine-specific phosphotransferase system component IIC